MFWKNTFTLNNELFYGLIVLKLVDCTIRDIQLSYTRRHLHASRANPVLACVLRCIVI